MVRRTLYLVFRNPVNTLIATFVAISVFAFAVWLPNLKLIGVVFYSEGVTNLEKLDFLFSLFGSITTNFSFVSALSTVTIAILFGVNCALLTYYFRKMRRISGGIRYVGSAGIGGLISGLLGVGCATCGTFILSSVLTLTGASTIISILPFGGEEFGFLGVGLLLYSGFTISKKIHDPFVC